MHLDEELLQRLRHGELTSSIEVKVREHLTECAACQERLAREEKDEAELYGLFRLVDHPRPVPDPELVATRARSHRLRHRGAWAAGFILSFGLAVAAYATPGSPLPSWLKEIVERITGGPAEIVAPAPGPSAEESLAGIAVEPGRNLLVFFPSPAAGSRVRVSWIDSGAVVVRAPNGAATFASDIDRLVISNQRFPAMFEIHIPRTAPHVEIRSGRQRILLKDGPSITTDASPDSSGSYLISLSSSGS